MCGRYLMSRATGDLLAYYDATEAVGNAPGQAFELGDQAPGLGLLVPVLQPVRSEVVVGLVAFKHVVGADED